MHVWSARRDPIPTDSRCAPLCVRVCQSLQANQENTELVQRHWTHGRLSSPVLINPRARKYACETIDENVGVFEYGIVHIARAHCPCSWTSTGASSTSPFVAAQAPRWRSSVPLHPAAVAAKEQRQQQQPTLPQDGRGTDHACPSAGKASPRTAARSSSTSSSHERPYLGEQRLCDT